MNKERREQINKAIGMIEEAKSIIETCGGEERDHYDNMPEAMQGGDKGTKADEAATILEEQTGECENIVSQLEEARGG